MQSEYANEQLIDGYIQYTARSAELTMHLFPGVRFGASPSIPQGAGGTDVGTLPGG